MSTPAPVEDWSTDWDHHAPEWVADPWPIWDELLMGCPIAHTDRYNEGVWLPTRHEDLSAIAHDTTVFSSGHSGATIGGTKQRAKFPPIHLDPPEHMDVRRELLPFFNPKRVMAWEPVVEEHCEKLARELTKRDVVDLASDYAAHIPAAVIAMILGIPPSDGDRFRKWIHALELGDLDTDMRDVALGEMSAYFGAVINERRADPQDDLISYLLDIEIDGERFDGETLQRILILQLIAGIDTTWGVLGASLLHLAKTPADRERLVADPSLIPNAIEEFLRAFASVSLWRTVTEPVEIGGVEMAEGDTVMMVFPAACRDPEMFEDADKVIIDRERNRHVAFGAGIHRCLGSNLARLELNVGIRTWLAHAPDFELVADANVTWAEGAIRGPRSVPVRIIH